ncbi:PKD domain-containing protein, partial [Bacteroidota bacterium]
GDGYTSNLQNPSHTFAGSGTYNVSLQVSNSNGCVNSVTIPILVNPHPDADFSYSAQPCENDTTQFTDLSVAHAMNLVSWYWDFGDGDTSTDQNPIHIYQSQGTFNVMLAVENSNGCVDTIYNSILLEEAPVANFDYDTACVQMTTHFTDLSFTQQGQIVSWYWNFDDPISGSLNTSTMQNPTHVFITSGIYNVMLIVSNTSNCQDTLIRPIAIGESPNANFTFSLTCLDDTTWFYNQSTPTSAPITTYIYDFGDGSIQTYYNGADTVGHVYIQSGQYHVTLTAIDTNGCTDSETKMIVAYPVPTALFHVNQNCINNVTHFTDYSNGSGANIVSWFWNFGDPASGINNTSTLQNPSHIFTQAGFYNVYLEVTNANGCSNSIIQTIEVFPGPVADFQFNTSCLNTPIFFDNLSYAIGENIISWFWDFGDGTTSNLQYPTHTYTSPGTYYVTLSVTTENGCTSDITKEVKVHTLPVADFDYNFPNCSGDTTYFIDQSYSTGPTFINSWYWDFGDGTYDSINQNPAHFYSAAGTYVVTLTVTDTNGCTEGIQKSVLVNEQPIAAYTYNALNCDSVFFFDSSSGIDDTIVSWYWDFGDPASGWHNYSNLQHPLHVYLSSGVYNVTLIVNDANGCSDTIIQSIDLERPNPAFVYSNVCQGSPTQFTNQSSSTSPIVAYLWDFGDGSTSTAEHPVHTFAVSGTYYVTLWVTLLNGCQDYVTQAVHVNEIPLADFDYNSPNCGGDSTYFQDLSSMPGPASIISWHWDFGDGTIDTMNQHPVHFYAVAGVYQVTLTVNDSYGCSDTKLQDVFVNAKPVAAFYHVTNSCDTVSFIDQSVGIGDTIAAWYWDFNDPSSGWNNYSTMQNPIHVFVNSGTYNVLLIVTDAHGCQDTVVHTIELNRPIADFSADTSCVGIGTQFTDLSSVATGAITGWSWDFGDGSTSTVQNPTHTYGSPGTYLVILTVNTPEGCFAQVSKTVSVNYGPTATFIFSNVCLGETVQFTDISTVPIPLQINNWYWDFGDGGTSTLQNPGHTYATPGLYHITLTVWTTQGCSQSSIQSINIIDAPIADFMADSTCQGEVTYFTDNSMAPGSTLLNWYWDFGDGSYAQGIQNPTHAYSSAGNYLVTLITTNLEGCSDTISKTVSVRTLPFADFNADTSCVSIATHFTDNSGGQAPISAYYWDFGDPASGSFNHSSLQHPEHYYGNPGLYNVTLSVTDIYGCQHSTLKQVLVTEPPLANFVFSNNQCTGTDILFTDQSITFGGIINSWIWNFGDGSPEITINYPSNPDITHSFINPGAYTVSLQVITTSGCWDLETHQVMIIAGPTADFDHTGGACVNDYVQFQDLSTSNGGTTISSWYWDFGDPSSPNNYSTLQHPAHMFTSAGPYTVTEIISNTSGCVDTITKSINISQGPPVDFYYDAICYNEPAYFYIDSTVVNWAMTTSYQWDFGDGTFSNIPNPIHIFNTTGLFDVVLSIEDTNGCENNITHTVDVRPLPLANFDHSGPICQYDSVFFQDYSSTTYGYIVRWTWDFDDGSPTQTYHFPNNPNVWHKYSLPGTYGVTLTVINSDSCTHTFLREVEVKENPIANFQWMGDCENELVQFTDASYPNLQGSIISWFWEFDDPGSGVNNISQLQNPMHMFSYGDSTYDVRLIIMTNENCSDTIDKQVFIKKGPPVDFIYDITCEDTLITFSPDLAVMDPTTIIDWLWDFGDGTYGYNQTAQHLYNVAGTYTVSLTATNTDGCSNTTTHDIGILQAPTPIFVTTPPNCMGMDVFFDDNSSSANGYITAWHWNFGDGTDTTILFPDNPDVYHSFMLAGTYFATLTITTSDSCMNDYTQQIIINNAPVAMFTHAGNCQDDLYDFFDSSQPNGGGNIISWSWDFGDPGSGSSNSSTQQNPTHYFSSPGSYDVLLEIENVNGCTDTITRQVNVSVPPPTDFTYENTCMGETTQFHLDTAITNPSAISYYDWDFGDGSPHSNQMNPTHDYTYHGSYVVTLMVTDTAGCENAITHSVDIAPAPVAVFNYTASCTGQSTYFIDHSYVVSGSPIMDWLWDFGDPGSGANNTSTSQNPNHAYATSGIYTVKLVVTTANGCLDSTYLDIQVYPGPTAQYSFIMDQCQTGLVMFEDSSYSQQAAIAEWMWTFEPGHFSIQTDPQYIFPNADTCYNVSLEVTDVRGCRDTIIKQVCIPEVFSMEIAYNQACLGEAIQFRDSIIAPIGTYLTDYYWDFGEPLHPNNVSTLPHPSHTYSNPGVYTVTLTATDNNGCPVTEYQQVMVDPLPVASFDWSDSPCDTTITFTDQSMGSGTPIELWEWNFGDGTPVLPIPAPNTQPVTHKYALPGVYNVTLIVTNMNGCMDTISQQVISNPCILSSFALMDSVTCEGTELHFLDNTQSNSYIVLYEWRWGDGTYITYQNQTSVIAHTYNNPGTYNVFFVIHGLINNNPISDTMKKVITVHSLPKAGFVCPPVCQGQASVFNDTSAVSAFIRDWSWNFGEPGSQGDTASVPDPSYIYPIAGDYSVVLMVTNKFGCTDSVRNTIIVSSKPNAGFSTSPVCLGDPTEFIDESVATETPISDWKWNFGDSISQSPVSYQQNPTHYYTQLGLFTVDLLVINETGCRDSISLDINVHAVPVSEFSVMQDYEAMQGNILAIDQSNGAIDYQWDWGDGLTTFETEPPIYHQYDNDGAYTIELVVWNQYGCVDTTYVDFEFLFKALYVPNAFAPESTDPEVKLFMPKGIGLSSYLIQVHDQWGNLVWESDKLDKNGSPAEAWNGTFKGKLLPQDVYLWRVKAVFKDGTIWEGESTGNMEGLSGAEQGTVTLIR